MMVKIYQDEEGNEPFVNWLESLKNQITRARIREKVRRIKLGNLGDHKAVGDGLFELRLHFGSGYRIYYGHVGAKIILLIGGGSKATQKKDIRKAKQYWEKYKQTI